MHRDVPKGISFAQPKMAEFGAANPHRILQHGIEHRRKLTGELEITFSTSEVAVCCSSASSRSRVSLATSASWLVADKLGLRSIGALRRFGARRFGGALERRLIVAPEGSVSYRAKISPGRGGLHSWIDQLNGWHLSALGRFTPNSDRNSEHRRG